MDLITDLGDDIAISVLINKKHGTKIESSEVLPLIVRLKEVLSTVSSRDHLEPFEEDTETTDMDVAHAS